MDTTTETHAMMQLLPNGIVQVQTRTSAIVEGQVLTGLQAASYVPGQSLDGVPADIAAVCEAYWTPERVAAYEATVAAANEAATQP